MKHFSCTLTKLECNLSAEFDGDELFILHEGKKIWPGNSAYEKGQNESTIAINVRLDHLESGKPLVLQLWDKNLLLSNRLLGEFLLVVDEQGGPFHSDLRRTDENGRARYRLEFKTHHSPDMLQEDTR